MKKSILLVLLLLCSGCATYRWQHPQFTQAGWLKDSYECERDMRQSAYFGGGIAGAISAGEFQERCLYAKGYEKVRVDTPPKSQPYLVELKPMNDTQINNTPDTGPEKEGTR